jgi:hypothetical protein
MIGSARRLARLKATQPARLAQMPRPEATGGHDDVMCAPGAIGGGSTGGKAVHTRQRGHPGDMRGPPGMLAKMRDHRRLLAPEMGGRTVAQRRSPVRNVLWRPTLALAAPCSTRGR